MESTPITGTLVTRPNRSADLVSLGSETVTVERLAGMWLADYGSPNTREAYARDLRTWLGWCESHGVSPLAAEHEHGSAFARELEAAGRKPTTVARALASVSSFYAWCARRGALRANPVANVRRPSTSEAHVDLTPALDRDELASIIAVAVTPQDRALVLMLAVLGLRITEALSLDLDAVEDVRGHRTVVVSGKGGRRDRMPLPPIVVDALEQIAAAENRTTGPVFVSRVMVNGERVARRMTRHGATRVLARLARRAGLSAKAVHPHVMRATAITVALEAGAPLRDVQDMARHADPRTTRRYDRARQGLDRHASYAVAAAIAPAQV